VGIDGSVLLFTLTVAALTALLFGVAPAYVLGRRASASLASSATRAVGGGRRPVALRRLLVTGEVALSLVVVILAGLIVRSFSALTSTDPRMDPANLLTFSVSMPPTTHPDPEVIPDEFERLLESVRSIPGVMSATAATYLPFGGRTQWDFQLDDRPARRDGEMAWNAGITHVSTDYFETLGIPILEGRDFTDADIRDAPLVVIVSETLAARYWPGQRVIGKRLGYEMQETVPWMTIVGVVPDPVTGSLDAEPYQHLYVPQAQAGTSTYFVPRALQIAVRGAVEVEGLVPAVRAELAEFDSDLPLYGLSTMEDVVASSYAGPRLTKNLIGTFALIALALAALGIYGVISYSVSGRTREIGVRIALGAERTEITRMILAEGARPLSMGLAVGLAGALLSARLVESMLFGVEPADPLTFVSLSFALLALGIVASWLPAARATRIPPTEALREE
jgi:putative ABC transport system permease protein